MDIGQYLIDSEESNNVSDNSSSDSDRDYIIDDKDIMENILGMDSENNNKIYLVKNNSPYSENREISKFLNFCIVNGIFINTFYDTNNVFSIISTKLPILFKDLSKDKKKISKREFLRGFKKLNYEGDINKVYDHIDHDKKGHITWTEFINFFLPFIKFMTI